MAIDAVIHGLDVIAEGLGSEYRSDRSRDELIHQLSWSSFTHTELSTAEVGQHILSGFEVARERARAGRQEIPRGRVDGRAVCERYYRALEGI